ncbi:MAG: hypothetical protein P8J87_13545 [Verrucomicrobiales bacterium]|nr:hypothetical protein [Verrucomicrobiales bacterium]
MEPVFEILYNGLSLKTTGIVLGVALIAAHVVALLKADTIKAWLPSFPRNKPIGVIILAIDLAWAWIVVKHMDMGEFYTLRSPLLIGLPIAFFLIITFAEEFLSVRALGTFLLLLACPVLNAAFLEDPWFPKLLVPALAYVWITAGLFYVGMPYLLRDHIDWLLGEASRFRYASLAGIGYGVLLLAFSIVFYG